MSDLLPVTLDEEIASVRREIGLREKAYPRWVLAKRMKQTTADREIAAMRAVLDRLSRIKESGQT